MAAAGVGALVKRMAGGLIVLAPVAVCENCAPSAWMKLSGFGTCWATKMSRNSIQRDAVTVSSESMWFPLIMLA